MSNARFSILQSRAIEDDRVSDAQFRTLAALGCYGDKEGWCFPSLSTLGKRLHKSPQAVSKDIGNLVEAGYLEKYARYDKESGSRKSNIYRLKFDTLSTPEVEAPSTPEVEAPSTPEVEVNVPYNDPYNANEDDALKTRTLILANLYEQNIGALTPLMSDIIRNAAIDYPQEWYEPAFRVAVENNARKWSYVEAVLDGWKRNGRDWKPARAFKPSKGQNEKTANANAGIQGKDDKPKTTYSAADLATAERINKRMRDMQRDRVGGV